MNADVQGPHISFTANVQYVLIHSTLSSVLSIFLFTVLMRHDRSLLVMPYYIFRDINLTYCICPCVKNIL